MISNEIIQGDCRDVMRSMETNSIDCVLTDPPYGLSFMGKDWDHGVPGKEFWEAALRVCKPGAFLLSFGGTRTFHRLTCAIEDAGFEIRDCMMWLYGSGFPKSHDVSKAIDKAAGAEREIVGFKKDINHSERGDININSQADFASDSKFTGKSKKPNYLTAPSTTAAKQWSGWGTALKPAWEPIIVARKPLEGTVAENVQKWGCGAMNIDGGRIMSLVFNNERRVSPSGDSVFFGIRGDGGERHNPSGRWPANVILDGEAGEMLDEQSGISKSSGGLTETFSKEIYGKFNQKLRANAGGLGDVGGASRFFYCAKASKRERGEGNNHPTVKPLSLLTYLIRLICPEGGIVLDPFVGSGSTALAAIETGRTFIGIEKESQYVDIARARIEKTQIPLVAA